MSSISTWVNFYVTLLIFSLHKPFKKFFFLWKHQSQATTIENLKSETGWEFTVLLIKKTECMTNWFCPPGFRYGVYFRSDFMVYLCRICRLHGLFVSDLSSLFLCSYVHSFFASNPVESRRFDSFFIGGIGSSKTLFLFSEQSWWIINFKKTSTS